MRPNDIKKIMEIHGDLNFGELRKILKIEKGDFRTWREAKEKLIK